MNLKAFLPPALFLGIAFALYAGSFGHPWIYDDYPVIVNNPDVLSVKNFLADTYGGRPLREITFLVDHAIFGMEPAGWHIQNIFWHGLNAALLFLLFLRLGVGRGVGVTASLLFLLHPLQVEVVANISHRKDSLALAFCLLTLLAFAQAFRPGGRRWAWLILSLVLGCIAYLGKENAVALIPLLIAYEWGFIPPEQRIILRSPRWVGGAAVLGAVAATIWLGKEGLEAHRQTIGSLLIKMNFLSEADEGVYFLTVLKSWVFMLLKFMAPFHLAPEYTFALPASWHDPWILAGLVLILLGGVGLWWSYRLSRPVFFALVWIVAFWFPVSNLWPLSYFAADRYLYAPMAGLGLLVALALQHVPGRLFRPAVIFVLLVSLAGLTVRQNRIWQSPFHLWSQAVKVSPDSTWALNNLGVAYMMQGDYALALPLFQKAANNFNDTLTLHNVGWAYENLGNTEQAFSHYRTFLSMNDPKYRNEARALRMRLLRDHGIVL